MQECHHRHQISFHNSEIHLTLWLFQKYIEGKADKDHMQQRFSGTTPQPLLRTNSLCTWGAHSTNRIDRLNQQYVNSKGLNLTEVYLYVKVSGCRLNQIVLAT